MNEKQPLLVEITNSKKLNQNHKIYELFEMACVKLKIRFEKYFRQDISVLYLYSCQIVINKSILQIASGKTEEEAYHNALLLYFEGVEQKDLTFIEEISENIQNIDLCDSFINICKNYFSKHQLSLIKKINYENIKKEFRNMKEPKILISEQYRETSDGKHLCSIFLNEEHLIQQGSGANKEEALENTIQDMFEAYSICQKENFSPRSDKPKLNLDSLFEDLRAYLVENKTITNYFDTIKTFVEKSKHQISLKFENGVSVIKIDGSTVAEGSGPNDYCANIEAIRNLVQKIKSNKKVYGNPWNNTSSGSAVSSNLKGNLGIEPVTNNVNYNQRQRLVSTDSAHSSADYSEEELAAKFRKIAIEAVKERGSNGTRPYWSIVNSLFLKEHILVEPSYNNEGGKPICILKYKNTEIIKASSENVKNSREEAALIFIKKFTSKL